MIAKVIAGSNSREGLEEVHRERRSFWCERIYPLSDRGTALDQADGSLAQQLVRQFGKIGRCDVRKNVRDFEWCIQAIYKGCSKTASPGAEAIEGVSRHHQALASFETKNSRRPPVHRRRGLENTDSFDRDDVVKLPF